MRQRLLAVDVFAELHRGVGDGRVHMVGRGDVAGVEVVGLFFEELAPVLVNAHLGKAGLHVGDTTQIDIGDGDELHEGIAGDRLDVGPRHAGGTEADVAENLARLGGEKAARDERKGQAGGADGFEEAAAGEGRFHGEE